MGVVNVTPDSFSDGGRWLDPEAAVAHGLAMVADGADLVDIGGQSTRPHADPVPEDEELRRTIPVVRTLAAAGAVVSIDTTSSAVAAAALDVGAAMVNDVTGGRADQAMPRLLARTAVPFVAMHWRTPGPGRPVHDDHMHYDDVVTEVAVELRERLQVLADAGVDPDRVVLDPGLGFSKNPTHNWALLARLATLVEIGRPILLGASRKRFLGSLLAGPDAPPVPTTDRDAATAAITTLAALAGVWCVRVHDVRASLDAVKVAAALRAVKNAVDSHAALPEVPPAVLPRLRVRP
jgi:dihydropteroate synthase